MSTDIQKVPQSMAAKDGEHPIPGTDSMHVDQGSTHILNPEIAGDVVMRENIPAKEEESKYGPWMIASRNYRRKNLDLKRRDLTIREKRNVQTVMDPIAGGSRFNALAQEDVEILHVPNGLEDTSCIEGSDLNNSVAPSKPKTKAQKAPPKGPRISSNKPNRQIRLPVQTNIENSNKNAKQSEEDNLIQTKLNSDMQQSARHEKMEMEKLILDTMSRYQNQMWKDHKAGKYVDNLFGNFIPVVRNGELEFLRRQSARSKDPNDVAEGNSSENRETESPRGANQKDANGTTVSLDRDSKC
ncbi:hypothetical protein RIF29_24874 [Crotalaria pallida]|uniref:Uncharacterized protein n=1 Tax=Crotalaria pallida TaxID=3830 RepID=A0AAN9EL48_CROPI